MPDTMMVLNVVAAHVVGELVVVDAFRAGDRVGQHLQIGVAPAAEIIAQRFDAFGLRAVLVFLGGVRGRRQQFRRRHPGLIVDDAVELALGLSL